MSDAAWGSATFHRRTMKPRYMRQRCTCGCGGRCTHVGLANGVVLMSGCEWMVRLWVRDHDAPTRLDRKDSR